MEGTVPDAYKEAATELLHVHVFVGEHHGGEP